MSLAALVLAGTRPGGDSMAQLHGVSHKALIEIGGKPMIARVVSALAGIPGIGRIGIAIEQAQLLASLSGDAVGRATIPIEPLPVEPAGPSATVAKAFARYGHPLLVTTADNALLRREWVEEFLAACPPDADVVVALASRTSVERVAPEAVRTWLRFAEGDFSGCNLFLLASADAAPAVAFWTELEKQRKRPLRMMARLGWHFALRYAMRQLSLRAAAVRFAQLAGGSRLAFVILQDGRAAMDVDKPSDLVLARQLVARDA